MDVDFMGRYTPLPATATASAGDDVQEDTSAGLRTLDLLSSSLSRPAAGDAPPAPPVADIADHAFGKPRRVVSILERAGHARFRRGPVAADADAAAAPEPVAQPPPQSLNFDFTKPNTTAATAASASVSSASFLSSVTAAEGSVSNGRSLASAAGKPPLPRKRPTQCATAAHSDSTTSRSCHCSMKREKDRAKMKVRVLAIHDKIVNVSPDDYSWRKYGQKSIKNSPYSRSYYKCSTVKKCPAKKHVERAIDNPTMLVVTYENNHDHSPAAATGNGSGV